MQRILLKDFATKASVVFIPEAGTGNGARSEVGNKYNESLPYSEESFNTLMVGHDLPEPQKKLVLIKESLWQNTFPVLPGSSSYRKTLDNYINEYNIGEALYRSHHQRFWSKHPQGIKDGLKNEMEGLCTQRCALLRVVLDSYRPVLFAGVHGKNQPDAEIIPYLELLIQILALGASKNEEDFVSGGDINATPEKILPLNDNLLEVLPNVTDTEIDWMCCSKGSMWREAFHTGMKGHYGLRIADHNNTGVSDCHNGIYAGFRLASAE